MHGSGFREDSASLKIDPMVSPLPELNRPPINEVVYGVGFAPIPLLKSAHFGLFWSRVRDRYPRAEDMPPIIERAEDGKPRIDPFAGRVWFLDDSQTRLIQLQRGRLYMNWRKVRVDDEYPRFSQLHPDFEQTVGEFADFITELGLGEFQPNQLELTYINHIYEGGGWRFPADAGSVLRPLAWKREAHQRLTDPTDLGWHMAFIQADGSVRLNASIASGQRKTDDAPVLKFELRAQSSVANRTMEQAFQWYPTAREEIVRTFFDLTTDEARENLWT